MHICMYMCVWYVCVCGVRMCVLYILYFLILKAAKGGS